VKTARYVKTRLWLRIAGSHRVGPASRSGAGVVSISKSDASTVTIPFARMTAMTDQSDCQCERAYSPTIGTGSMVAITIRASGRDADHATIINTAYTLTSGTGDAEIAATPKPVSGSDTLSDVDALCSQLDPEVAEWSTEGSLIP
jgi:hypothetical protein